MARSDLQDTAAAGFADLGRRQMAVAADGACALFRGFETIRRIQADAAHEALTRHLQAARALHAGASPAELAALPAQLFNFDLDRARAYWQQLAAATMEMNSEIAACAGGLLDSETLLHAAHALEPGPAPAGRRRARSA